MMIMRILACFYKLGLCNEVLNIGLGALWVFGELGAIGLSGNDLHRETPWIRPCRLYSGCPCQRCARCKHALPIRLTSNVWKQIYEGGSRK